MRDVPPEIEVWIKITDEKEAHRQSIETGKKFDEKSKQYAREEYRRNMCPMTSERCSDCEAKDIFEENFCPICGIRLEPEIVAMTLEKQITELWKSRNLSVIEINVINVGKDRFQWTVLAEPPADDLPICPTCNGSGFIPETGAGCPSCIGKGVLPPEHPAGSASKCRICGAWDCMRVGLLNTDGSGYHPATERSPEVGKKPPTEEPIKGIIRRHALDPLCLECYQAIKEGKNECPKCHQVLLGSTTPTEEPKNDHE